MLNYYFLTVSFLLVSTISLSQELNDLAFYGKEHFSIEGTKIDGSLKESPYDRLPKSYKDKVREPVWNLSKASAGLSVRFLTNSSSIAVKWTLLNNNSMNHMAETGIKGLDLYFNNEGNWQYINTARPTGKENEALLISNMATEIREFKIYLPLYDGIVNLEIGIDSNSVIKKPALSQQAAIFFYGTSITQGGCASRPGMAHTNIISRELDVDCINLGFSGNGKMEQPIVDLISTFSPLFYVIECLPNMNEEQVTERTIPLVKTIRSAHPETPIILVENFIYSPTALNQTLAAYLDKKNEALKQEYDKLQAEGYRNIHYINGEETKGVNLEGTVDGTHFTDLGFMQYTELLIHKFSEFGLIQE